MRKNFLDFVTWLTDPDCPWHKSIISIHVSYIDVMFVTSCQIHPSDLGWLNTHAVGGRWFITSENDEIQVIVRFQDDDEILG